MNGEPVLTSDQITITPSSPHVGAEIGNIDLTKPLSDQQLADLRAAFLKHGVIFFREQNLSFADQMRLAE